MGTLVRDFCYMPGNRDALKFKKVVLIFRGAL